ncbi:rubrivinodin family lasso peptide [Paucibacter sp. KBW04]|nr:rubrivinodin family lasso peptide [Paucibacter sp. KBW04]
MNEKSQTELELQVVVLGDAKELTMGVPAPYFAEDNPLIPAKYEN